MQIYIFFLFRKNKSDTICTMAYISMFFFARFVATTAAP